MLLDLLLQRRAQLQAQLLEEADLDHLRVGRADPDVEAGVVAVRLQEVPADSRRQDAQIGHGDARRVERGDHRPLHHPAGAGRLTARDDAGAAVQCGPEGRGQPDDRLRREIDVDEARDAVLPEEPRRGARLPDHALVDLDAGLDLLVRVDPDARHDRALRPEHDLVADRGALMDADVRADVARPADDRALDDRAAADVRGRVDHRADGPRPLAEGQARREHGVRADRRLGRDPAVVADERRPFDALEVVDLDALPHPDVPAQADARDVQLHPLVERVEVRLPELVDRPDVLPVPVAHVPVEGAAHLEQEREELLREVERAVGGDVAEHLGLEHVDAGVDRVGEDLAPRRLLEEALDPALVVGDDDPELERVLDRLEPDRDRRVALAVELDEARQVDVTEGVAGDDERRLLEPAARETNRAGRAEWSLLDGVLDLDAEAGAVAEVAADRLRQERDRDDDLLEAVVAQELDDVLHARLADDRHHRLRLVRGQRPQTRALASRHDHGLHVFTSIRALRA